MQHHRSELDVVAPHARTVHASAHGRAAAPALLAAVSQALLGRIQRFSCRSATGSHRYARSAIQRTKSARGLAHASLLQCFTAAKHAECNGACARSLELLHPELSRAKQHARVL
eukprot:6178134-Pleurochrysis_carterae.AAC.2